MRMETGLDTGPVLACRRTLISPEDTAGTLHDRLAALGAPLMVEALGDLEAGRAAPEPQPEAGVTYAAKIDKAEARIDWTRPAEALSAHVRGLSPFPGAWFEADDERVKVLMARAEPGRGAPGEVLDDALLVACGEGAIRLVTLQRAGRGPLPAEAFLRGFALGPGARLG
jgi:methionyl-tRNA formyltransferase